MDQNSFVQGLDLFPFSQIVWNSPEAQKQWSPILERARGVHDLLEYEMVKQGHRRCATLHLSPCTFDRTIERITRDGLVWLPIQRTQTYGGFSHKHFPVNELDINSTVYGVLARNTEDAEAFRRASTYPTDHLAIAQLLGFPSCCAQAFVDWWPTYFDPVYQCAQVTQGSKIIQEENYDILETPIHIATQQMLRYTGFRLTSHFPCSLDCEESKHVGQTWFELGKQVDPQGTDALLRILSLPGTWSCCHGVAVVELEPFTIVTNSLPTKRKWVVRWSAVEAYGG